MDTETAASTPQNGIPVVEMKIGCRLKVKKFADDEYSWRMSSKLALVPSVGARGPCHLCLPRQRMACFLFMMQCLRCILHSNVTADVYFDRCH
jgi:hypothetical protein